MKCPLCDGRMEKRNCPHSMKSCEHYICMSCTNKFEISLPPLGNESACYIPPEVFQRAERDARYRLLRSKKFTQ
jgi:hypothetical protein